MRIKTKSTVANQAAKLTDTRSCAKQDLQEHDVKAPSFSDTIPQAIVQQVIYFHTKPAEIVFDPFAGTGVTADACKMMSRRFFCSDLFVFPGREKDIKQWDITSGLPPDLPDLDLVILDPPYPEQPDGEFSKPTGDLSRMNLMQFNSAMRNLYGALMKKNVKTIAFVYPPERHAACVLFESPMYDFNQVPETYYSFVDRQFLLGRTEKYGRQSLEHASEENNDQFEVRCVQFWQRRTP